MWIYNIPTNRITHSLTHSLRLHRLVGQESRLRNRSLTDYAYSESEPLFSNSISNSKAQIRKFSTVLAEMPSR